MTSKNTKYFLLALGFLLCIASYAQVKQDTVRIKVSGQIIRLPDSVALESAEVFFKGKPLATLTDAAGKFQLNGFRSDTAILVTAQGFSIEEIKLTENTEFYTIALSPLPELVNSGFQTPKLTTLASAIAPLKGELLDQSVPGSFEIGMQGRLPGVQITQNSGSLNSAPMVRIRGINSVLAGSEPLYVIDGVPVISGTNGDGGGAIGANMGYVVNPLSEINYADIERVDVLKDGAATAIFGARGSNGVVLVTTKRGRPGKTRFDLGYFNGPTFIENNVGLVNGQQYVSAVTKAYTNSYGANPLGTRYLSGGKLSNNVDGLTSDIVNSTNTDWLKQSLQAGVLQQLSLSAQGGSKRVNFFMNGTYRSEKSVAQGASYDRVGFRFNADNKATERLTLGISNYLSLSSANLASAGTDTAGGFGMAQYKALPIFPIYFDQSNVTLNSAPFNKFFNPWNGANIVAQGDEDYAYKQKMIFRNIGSVYGSLKINKNLLFKSEAGFDYFTNTDRNFSSRYVRRVLVDAGNGSKVYEGTTAAEDNRSIFLNLNFNNTLSFTDTIAEKHFVSALGGATYNFSQSNYNGASSQRFPNDYSKVVSSGTLPSSRLTGGADGYAFMAYFAKANYNFAGKYTAELTFRLDQSSRYGSDYSGALSRGLALGWVLSETETIKNLGIFSFLKSRISAGRTGNSAFWANNIAQGYYSSGQVYADPASFYPGSAQYNIPNTQLTPEFANDYTAGIDFGFLGGRVTGSIDYYYKLAHGLLLGKTASPTAGVVSSAFYGNYGAMSNQGLELGLSTKNTHGKVQWTTDFNVTFNANRVTSTGSLSVTDLPMNGDVKLQQGQSIGTYYLARYAGLADKDDLSKGIKAGDELILDANGYAFKPKTVGQVDSARVAISDKSSLPFAYGGLNNSVQFAGWDFGVLITYSLGAYVLDNGERLQSYVTGSNTLRASALNSGANLYYSSESPNNGKVVNDPLSQRNTTRFLHNASYARLRSLTIGYTLSKDLVRKIHLEKARFYISAQNLILLTPFKGWDPEVVANSSSPYQRNLGFATTTFAVPQVRSVVGGFTFTF